tara:strand:- start:556 stop:918 length:363 start_codon:yes stop_codon:yes gene_type:complete
VLGLAKKGNIMTQSFQWLITSSGYFQHGTEKKFYNDLAHAEELPENFEDACYLAYDHCKDCTSIRVLRLDRDTNTFEDQTNRVELFVAQNLLDRRDEEHGFPEWAQDAYNSLEIVLEGDY